MRDERTLRGDLLTKEMIRQPVFGLSLAGARKNWVEIPGRLMRSSVLSILAWGFLTPTLAQHASPIDPPGTGAATKLGTVAALTVQATFKWSVPERYPLAWRAWDMGRANYEASYVHPPSWP